MAHFYLNEELAAATVGERISVGGAEARHAVSVSKLAAGDRISVGNGAGLVASGPVLSAEPAEFVVAVEEVTDTPLPSPALWLAQALAKGGRDEYAVQQATELGVDGVIPWAAQRSIVKWEGSKIAKGRQRWSAIAREATKQSLRPWIPELGELASTLVLCALANAAAVVVLDPAAEEPLSSYQPDGRDIVLVVGPEGGITEPELSRFEVAGASLRRLGDSVLRTSTAGPAAISVLNTRLGRW